MRANSLFLPLLYPTTVDGEDEEDDDDDDGGSDGDDYDVADGELYDVGWGRKMFLMCRGKGPPTGWWHCCCDVQWLVS